VEIETQVLIGLNLGYLTEAQGTHLLKATAELGRILNGLLASIRAAA